MIMLMNHRRAEFEAYIRGLEAAIKPECRQPWSLVERSRDADSDGYLDLSTQLRWEGWKAFANSRLTVER